MNIRAVVLDTNHLSDLARNPSDPASVDLLNRLTRGDGVLAVTYFTIVELSNPGFSSLNDVRTLLQLVPHVLANPFDDVEDEEMACAVARANGLQRRPPRVFARDTSEWGYHIGPVGGGAMDLVDAFRASPQTREEFVNMAAWGADASMMKTAAALIREPALPVTAAITRHLALRRATFPEYGRGLSAPEVLERIGGREALPAYFTQQSMLAERMKDVGQKSTGNDVFDEFTCFYSPYAAVTAVDRRTLHRAKMARVPAIQRMTRHLSEVSQVLDAVVAGALQPCESAF